MTNLDLNFYPGPSKLYPQVKKYLLDAYDSGILAKNHRSEAGMALLASTKEAVRKYLNVPADYHIYLTSSSTECWEIVCQSLCTDPTHFLYSGAFGKKWFKYAVLNHSPNYTEPRGSRFHFNDDIINLSLDENTQTLCYVDTETSNGSIINEADKIKIRSSLPNTLIAVDATASLGGINHDFNLADVWFASVQKCFGLPSGLAVLIVSDKALSKSAEISDKNYYNSLNFIEENFSKNQTHYTPNILGIYTLGRLCKDLENINSVDLKIKTRSDFLYTELEKINGFKPLVMSKNNRADTVICIENQNSEEVLKKVKDKNISLGKGYGEWAENSFRIANFPAISDNEYDVLIENLKAIC